MGSNPFSSFFALPRFLPLTGTQAPQTASAAGGEELPGQNHKERDGQLGREAQDPHGDEEQKEKPNEDQRQLLEATKTIEQTPYMGLRYVWVVSDSLDLKNAPIVVT